MEHILFYTIIITIIFSALKLLEIRFLEKAEDQDYKILIREIFFVFAASFVGLFLQDKWNTKIMDFFYFLTGKKDTNIKPTISTQIFTDEPNF